MENTDNGHPELEALHEQAALLKKKLDQETIVSEEVLRKTMSRKVRTINAQAITSGIAAVVVIAFAIFYFPTLGLSTYFSIGTIVMMLICVFFTLKYHKNVNAKSMGSDLVSVAKIMKKLKTDYMNWLKYGFAMAIGWATWFCIELRIASGTWHEALSTVIAVVVGLFLGGFIGFRMHKKVVNTCDEIIDSVKRENG
ncbi:MAG: hypothetical protein MJZ49_07575 [Bacteroidales bacterium]|nr:hypothetical protein [Bacteroidales bacterium]